MNATTSPSTATADRLLIAPRLFDGRAGISGADQAVAISGDRITDVGAATELEARYPDAAVERFHDATLSPGLIDSHVHLTMPGDGTAYEPGASAEAAVRFRVAQLNLRTHLEGGVTCVRDLGSHLDFLDWHPDDAVLLPRLVRYGPPITAERGHMYLFGGGAKNPEEARRLAERNIAAGSDGIKIASSGGGTLGTVPHKATIDGEIVAAAVATAHEHGRLATTHALSLDTMRTAIESGTDGIEHLGFLDPDGHSQFSEDLADLAISRQVTFGSTLGCNDRFTRLRSLTEDDQPERVDQLERTAYYIRNASLLRERGARIAAASDAGWKYTHFGDFSNELRLLCLAGYSPAEVLHLATGFNAEYLRLDSEIGYLRPGMCADIVVFRGNPLESIADTRNVTAVFRSGVRVHNLPFV